jgi:glycosyltransferase involved in cell wall biosynthesis
VEHGGNGLLVDVEDPDAIADWAARVREDGSFVDGLRRGGRETAELYAHERLDDRWAALFDGFVERPA